jgi:hypothetical protein
MMLDVANDGTFWNRSQRQDVPDDEVRLLAAVDKLSGVHALGGDKELLLVLVAEGMAESDACERCATARVVDDLSDDALLVAIALAEVKRAEAGRSLAVMGVGLEHRPCSLTLCPDHTTHFGGLLCA